MPSLTELTLLCREAPLFKLFIRHFDILRKLEITKKLGRIGLDAKFRYTFHQPGNNEPIYGFGQDYELTEELEMVPEIHGRTRNDFGWNQPVLNLGTRWEFSSTLILMAKGGRSLHEPVSDEPALPAYIGVQLRS